MITPHEQYLRMGCGDELRREAYRALFKPHTDPELIDSIRSVTNGNTVLGNGRFAAQIAKMLKRQVTRGKAGRPVGQG